MCSGFTMPSCFQRIALREVVADEGGVDGAIHHHMRHMDAARPQLARHALGQRAQRMLGTGKGGKARAAAQRGGGTGEHNGLRGGPRPARVTMRLATSRPFRKPLKQAISQILKYLRADCSRMLLGTLAPMLNTITSMGPMVDSICSTSAITSSSLRASEAKPCAAPPSARDLVHQRLQLVQAAAGDAGHIAFACKAAGDGAAGGVTCANHHERHLFMVIPCSRRLGGWWPANLPPRSTAAPSLVEIAVAKRLRLGLAQQVAGAGGRQLRRVGMEVHRHGHGADGHQRGAAAPDAGEEHVGQRRQRGKVQRPRRVVAQPQAGAAAPWSVPSHWAGKPPSTKRIS
jgi:hypothetical protein